MSPSELLRLVGEHLAIVALLLLGLVVAAFLRDERVPSVMALGEWLDPSRAALHLGAFGARLQRFRPEFLQHLAWDVVAAAILQYSLSLHGLYDRQGVRRARLLFLLLVRAGLVAGVVLAVVFFFTRPPEFGRVAPVTGYALAILGLWAARSLSRELAVVRPEALLIVGEGPVVDEALEAVRSVPPGRYHLVGRVGEPEDRESPPWIGGWEDLGRALDGQAVDRVLLATTPPGAAELEPIVAARLTGTAVVSARGFAESITGEVLEADPGAEFVTEATSRTYGAVSRLLDALLSSTLLVLVSPVMLLGALLVLLTDGRPAFFSQERVGRGGRTFRLFKLRTMSRDAERAGPAWSPQGDPRVTRLGGFLRRWRVDEIPQLWNVLRGDMAFVGPRPEQPLFVDRLSERLPHYALRHLVRPGLTGWAQVKLPYAASDEESRRKLRFDLFHVKHRSPALDLAILFDTVRVVLLGRGR
jgi:exopolysaccharide biosynthesis polyprenyl glycosylphosphotransferase